MVTGDWSTLVGNFSFDARNLKLSWQRRRIHLMSSGRNMQITSFLNIPWRPLLLFFLSHSQVLLTKWWKGMTNFLKCFWQCLVFIMYIVALAEGQVHLHQAIYNSLTFLSSSFSFPSSPLPFFPSYLPSSFSSFPPSFFPSFSHHGYHLSSFFKNQL